MDLMAIRRKVLSYSLTGGKDMKLVYSGVISQDYTSTAKVLYEGEIKNRVTFGDYHKLCICIFEGNSYASNPVNVLFFTLAVDPSSFTANNRNGGMIRQGYSNLRSLDLTNDARVSAGTVLKIYTIDI